MSNVEQESALKFGSAHYWLINVHLQDSSQYIN